MFRPTDPDWTLAVPWPDRFSCLRVPEVVDPGASASNSANAATAAGRTARVRRPQAIMRRLPHLKYPMP